MPGSCGQRMYADALMGIARRKEGNRASTNHDGSELLRMLVTGGPPNFGGGGMPQRIMISSRSSSALRTTGAG